MELEILKMDSRGEKQKGFFIHVTREEAMKLIRSLAEQIIHNNPSVNRLESYTKKNEYVSIGVIPEELDKVSDKKYCHRVTGIPCELKCKTCKDFYSDREDRKIRH
jgi:hypothetical protein